MKKVLVASTALVAAGLMTVSTAQAAEKIKLNLGGYSKWWVVGAWQDDSFEQGRWNNGGTRADAANVDIKGDNEIFFGGETTLDNGMTVGIQVELEAGGTTDSSQAAAAAAGGNADTIDKSYVYIQGGFGKFILGAEANGTVLLHVMAPDAAGNWAADGILSSGLAISSPTGGNFNNTIISTEIDTDGEADKITYVAPTFYGLTVGASYIPHATGGDDNPAVPYGSVEGYGVGALYANEFGGVGLKVSGGYVIYDVGTNAGQNKDVEWSAGTHISYAGFTLGGSYRDRSRDDQAGNNGNTADGKAYDVALQYASGPYAVSVGMFKSQNEDTLADPDDDEITLYQVSGKYALGPGVDVLASVGHIEYDDEADKAANGDANHNKGWAVMTGLGLTF